MDCIVLDDNKVAQAVLSELIAQTGRLRLIATCSSAREGLDVLRKNRIDLIFLDVEMPGLNGFDFLKMLEYRPLTIIVSGEEKYAIESYDYNVVDFLLKPVNLDRFQIAVQKAEYLVDLKESSVNVQQAADFIFVKDKSILKKIPLKDIDWMESQGDYVKIMALGKSYMAHISLNSMEKKLEFAGFMRVHRRYVVSLEKIDHVEDYTIVMDGKLIPVSESYRDLFRKNINII